ncbi:MAG: efflux RND transporter permease subunit [Planctomycetota bacterium]
MSAAPSPSPSGTESPAPDRTIATLFARHPRLTALTVALLTVAGLAALELLPRAEDPELAGRIASITTLLPGADAARVEALVTEPLEDALAEFEELKSYDSVSRAGISLLTIELRDEVTGPAIDEVWSRVRDELSEVRATLPTAASAPDFEELKIVANTMLVALRASAEDGESERGRGGPARTTADARDRAVLGRHARDLADRLRALNGTEDVRLFGEPEEELRVDLDPAQLAATGLDTRAVAAALTGVDAKVPAGQVRGATDDLLLEVSGELSGLDRLRDVVLREGDDGRTLRLGDVATLTRAERAPVQRQALISGRDGVVVAARMQTKMRVDRWSAAARAELREFEATLPRGVELDVLFDQSVYTEARLRALFMNFAMGAGLVVLVLLFTMGLRSALIVGASLPLTTLVVLAGMRQLGIPMHQMSIAGLIIALGLLIDNAIVVVDEVRNRIDEHDDVIHAIGAAVRHLAVPLFGSTLTTCFAFAPIALMPGGAGEFVGAMALSVIIAVASSLVLALTVIPAFVGFVERWRPMTATGWLARGVRVGRLSRVYARALGALFARPVLGIAVAVALPVAGFIAATRLPEQFFPPADRDQFVVDLRLDPTASLERTRAAALRAREVILAHPRVDDVHVFLGASAPKFYYNLIENVDGASFYAQALVELDGPERSVDVVRDVQRALDAALPDVMVLAKQIEQGPPFDAPVELSVYGPDLAELRRSADELRTVLASLPHVTHTRATIEGAAPKLRFTLDEAAARRAGYDNASLAGALQAAFEGALGGSVVEASEELPVRVRVRADERDEARKALSLPLLAHTASGAASWTTFDALGSLELAAETAGITHKSGSRASSVKGYIEAGVLPSTVLASFLAAIGDPHDGAGFELPRGYRLEVGGESAERDEAVGNLASSVAVLLVLMAAALVLSFNSFRMATVIGSVAFLSVGLALLSVALAGYPFGFMTIVGTMGLVGVAINDSIVVLAALREDVGARRGDVRATVGVVVHATRHVLSTTLTTAVGFLPLVLGGGNFWPPVGVAIGGGVLGATVIALTYVPTVHLLLSKRWRRA